MCAMLHILARGLRAGNGLWQSTWKGRVGILEVGYKTNMEAFNLQSHFLRTRTIMESRTLLEIFESKLEETARLFFSNNMITVDLVTTIYNVLFWGLAIPAVAYLLKILGGLKIGEKNMNYFPFMQNLDFLLCCWKYWLSQRYHLVKSGRFCKCYCCPLKFPSLRLLVTWEVGDYSSTEIFVYQDSARSTFYCS